MPADAIALLIVLLFAVPGLITRTLLVRSIPRQQGDVQQWVVEVILFGAISFLITTVVYSVVAGIRNEPPPDLAHFPPRDPPLIVAAIVYVAGFMVLPAAIGLVLLIAYQQGLVSNLFRLLGVRYIDATPRMGLLLQSGAALPRRRDPYGRHEGSGIHGDELVRDLVPIG